jgi:hypothetical protein
VAPGRANRGNDAETRAHSNSSWCREGPRISLINGLSCTKESRAWPGHPILIPRGGPRPCGSYQQNTGNRCANRRSRRSRSTVEVEVTKGYGSSWIFEPCLTCANALRRVQHPAFSLVCALIASSYVLCLRWPTSTPFSLHAPPLSCLSTCCSSWCLQCRVDHPHRYGPCARRRPQPWDSCYPQCAHRSRLPSSVHAALSADRRRP